jgi:hypothetical protein
LAYGGIILYMFDEVDMQEYVVEVGKGGHPLGSTRCIRDADF